MGQRAADYQVATLLSLCPGSRFKCAERTTSIVGFTANRIDPIKKSQSAARVVEVKKKKPARSGQTAENPGRSGHRNPGDFGEATLTDLGEAVAYRGPYRIIGQSGVEVFDVGHGVLSHGGTEGGSHQLTPNPLACRLPAFSTRRCLFNDQSVPKPCTSGNVDRSRVWASSPRRNASLRTRSSPPPPRPRLARCSTTATAPPRSSRPRLPDCPARPGAGRSTGAPVSRRFPAPLGLAAATR